MSNSARISIACVVVFFLVLGFRSQRVFATEQNYDYPSLLWGPTTVIENLGPDQQTFYSQTEGNEIMRNDAASVSTSPNFVFGPYCTILGQTADCFALSGSYSASLGLLNSRTSINGKIKNNTAVLREAGVNVFGDSFSASGNFNYWGRHLRETTGQCNSTTTTDCSNAFWQISSYQFNPAAQAYWNSAAADKNQTMNQTIERLRLSAKPVGNVFSNFIWTKKPFDGICGDISTNCAETNQYPEGRVWRTSGGASISGTSLAFKRKATLIVEQGDLLITTDIKPIDQQSSLGFIIRNGSSVSIVNTSSNKMTVEASIFAPKGTISVRGNKIDLIGSFVANKFSVLGNNINFIQDTRGEDIYPPGFRELQIPSLLAK